MTKLPEKSPYLLVGMLDSPFVRRVAIAFELAEIPYENLSLATVGDAEKFSEYSPLKRAPTLVLPSGEVLFDSQIILEFLRKDEPSLEKLFPKKEHERLVSAQILGGALGFGDKAVSALYEKTFHNPAARSVRILERNRGQLADTLVWLEARAPEHDFLFGAEPSLADITVGTVIRFGREVHPTIVELPEFPRLEAWTARLDALPAFEKTYLAVDPPK